MGGIKSLSEYEIVEYDLVQGPKGLQAVNVTAPGGGPIYSKPSQPTASTGMNFNHPFNGFGYQPVMTAEGYVAYVPVAFSTNGLPYMNMYQGQTQGIFPSSTTEETTTTSSPLIQMSHMAENRYSLETNGNNSNASMTTMSSSTSSTLSGSLDTSGTLSSSGSKESSLNLTSQPWFITQQQPYQMPSATVTNSTSTSSHHHNHHQMDNGFPMMYTPVMQPYGNVPMFSPLVFMSNPQISSTTTHLTLEEEEPSEVSDSVTTTSVFDDTLTQLPTEMLSNLQLD